MASRDVCSVCGKTVYRTKCSKPDIVCRDCRWRDSSTYRAGTVWQCEWCDVTFALEYNRRNGKPRFCSQSCASHYANAGKPAGMKAVRRCEACGKGFRPQHSKGQRFCSRDCFHMARPRKQKAAPVERTCAECGATYTGRQSKYCGPTCAAGAKRRKDREYARSGPKPQPKPVVVVTINCWVCDTELLVPEHRAHQRYCSRRCRRAALRGDKERAAWHGAYYEPVVPHDIYVRDGWTCQLCGDPVDPLKRWPDQMCASLDHIKPISEKGPHRPDNLRLAHWLCNSLRGVDDIDFMLGA